MGGASSLQASNLGTSVGFHIFTTAFTFLRLASRYQDRELWWDDCWALASLLFGLVHMTEPMWCQAPNQGSNPMGPSVKRDIRGILAFWVTSITFTLGIWTARISIGTSITRFSQQLRLRRPLFFMNVAFGLMCAGVLVPGVIGCAEDSEWHSGSFWHPKCHYNALGIVNVIFNISGDVCLVLVPLYIILRIDLPKVPSRSLIQILMSGVLNLVYEIVYTIFVVKSWNPSDAWQGWKEFANLMSHPKLALTLMVSNLPVIVAFINSFIQKNDDYDDRGFSSRRHYSTSLALTDISELTVISESIRMCRPLSSLEIKSLPDFSPSHDRPRSALQVDDGCTVATV